MGRYLDLARQTDLSVLPSPLLDISLLAPSVPPISLPTPPPLDPAFDCAAADVLAILVHAEQPMPHAAIVRALIARGHDKTAARQAIARCQRRRWIAHNLVSGYALE